MSRMDLDTANEIVACPGCGGSISLEVGQDVGCKECSGCYRWVGTTWELIPAFWPPTSEIWKAWQQVQANGIVSYAEDPESNLGVGDRADCLAFSRFCGFDGMVLDVGCGPQPWPAYFNLHASGTRFVGIDPLAGRSRALYLRFRALGEYLPFRDDVFDHVVFATSLDHFVDPLVALGNARRVCKARGSIEIWIGDKDPSAPKPIHSPGWYEKLEVPALAQDAFHIKRLNREDTERLSEALGLKIVREERLPVDPYRTNYFLELRDQS